MCKNQRCSIVLFMTFALNSRRALAVLSNFYLLQEFEVQSLIEFSLYTFDLDVSYNTEFGRRIPYWK